MLPRERRNIQKFLERKVKLTIPLKKQDHLLNPGLVFGPQFSFLKVSRSPGHGLGLILVVEAVTVPALAPLLLPRALLGHGGGWGPSGTDPPQPGG